MQFLLGYQVNMALSDGAALDNDQGVSRFCRLAIQPNFENSIASTILQQL